VRSSTILYLAGFLTLLLGERIFGPGDPLRPALSGAGVMVALAALAAVARGMAQAQASQKAAHQQALLYGAVGVGSLAIYALGLDPVVEAIGFADDEAIARYKVLISAAWPIPWLAGTLGFLAVERSLATSPTLVMPGRVREAGAGGLSVGLALAMLFPLNYLAAQYNHRWDFGYFKTARPGTSTKALVDGLEEPIDVWLFFPVASDVTEELKTYFGELEGARFRVNYLDHALEPELAKELQVRDNGYVVFGKGEGEDRQLQKLNLGKDFDSAKRKLRKLDEEVRENLMKVARGKRTAYFTVGHGEMFWDSDTDIERKATNLKKVFSAMNFKVKELGLANGLAAEVPDDAGVVVIAAPTSAFDEAELAALDAYRKKGGSLLVLLEPGAPDMTGVLGGMGIKFDGSVTLASDANFLPVRRANTDRANLITNKYSTHPSVTTLSRNSREAIEVFFGAGALLEEGTQTGRTVTTRTLPEVWGDKDGDFTFDEGEETRGTYNLAMAASGPAEGGAEGEEWRAVVVADSTWASDLALLPERLPANYQAALDAVLWLGNDESIAGTVNSEEDVKIEHSKEGQGWLFYGTSLLAPLALTGLGLARLKLRRKSGGAA